MAYKIESKIKINAPINEVWDILTDFENYHSWNTFTPKIELNKEIGSTVTLHVKMNPEKDKIIKQKEELLIWQEGKQIDWGITKSLLINTIRTQKLTPINNNATEYYTSDIFKGVLAGLVIKLYGKRIQNGFDNVAVALKTKAE